MSSTEAVYFSEDCCEARNEETNKALPDDIIPIITSHLNVQDAVSASIVLSRRWKEMLTNLTNLDFGTLETVMLKSNQKPDSSSMDNANRYVNWVDRVLSLNGAPYIKEFRVCFPLGRCHAGEIDRWVRYAISKHVKKLELDFSVNYHFFYDAKSEAYYWLRNDVLDKGLFIGLYSLTSLTLKFVNIDKGLLDLVLSQCLLLERLVVENTCHLRGLKVTNPCRRLKHLAIRRSHSFTDLRINLAAAMSFKLTCFRCFLVPCEDALLTRFEMDEIWNLEVDFVNNDDFCRVNDLNTSQVCDVGEVIGCQDNYSFLKSLHLKSVGNMGVSLVNLLIGRFRSLERLILEESDALVSMKITSSLRKLKHVEIRFCEKFAKLEIDLLDVLSLKVACSSIALKLECITDPFLLKFDISSEKNFSLIVDIDYVQGTNHHPCTLQYDGNTERLIHSSPSKISTLMTLNFVGVNISKEVLEYLLEKLPLLEQLLVRSSDDLVSLKVMVSSKSLKYLDICHCRNMKELEVHAPNLMSLGFAWNHKFANLVYGRLPSLVDVYFGDYMHRLLSSLWHLRIFSRQLTKLSLQTAMVVYKDLVIPTFDNLKNLVFRVSLRHHEDLIALIYFARTCPLLHKFTLEIKWNCNCDMTSSYKKVPDLTEEHGLKISILPHLRNFELVGPFRFNSHVDYEYAFILCIVKNAIKLEKLVFNTQSSVLVFPELADTSKEQQIDAARQLAKLIPSNIDVAII